ncbi:MAG: type III-A CRISPR-associated RAMP protein Csm5, partial [Candidatus Omnitrophica bacterium]|nr:type III-A CRISPR-associated RAMP protein Csm5 [Candidatus Omnitrophota bacterium]
MKIKLKKIKLKILTPVHIGSGQEISPIEYLISDGKFIRIDMDGLFLDPEFKPLQEKFINSAKSQRYIGDLLPKDLLLKHILYSLNISQSAKGTNPIVVKEFIKSAGRVYIPGSSLKGSILSGVMEEVLLNKRIKKISSFEEHLNEVLSEIAISPQGRFSHWLDLKDSNFSSPEESLEIVQVKVIGARRGQLPILYESLKENLEFELEIISHSHKPEEEILQMADNFYRKVYNKEREYVQKLKQQLPSPSANSFLLRIGQGSTAWATSFLILAEELGIKNYTIQRPKSHVIKGPP